MPLTVLIDMLCTLYVLAVYYYQQYYSFVYIFSAVRSCFHVFFCVLRIRFRPIRSAHLDILYAVMTLGCCGWVVMTTERRHISAHCGGAQTQEDHTTARC